MRPMQFLLAVALGMAFALPVAANDAHHGHEAPEASPAISTQAAVALPRPAVGEWTVLRMHLAQPEYWHVLINPFPILGMTLAAPLLLFGLAARSRGAKEAGLVLILLTSLVTLATVKVGQRAYDRIYNRIELESQQWLDVHMERAEGAQWAFYLTGFIAALALAMSRRNTDWERRATLGALSGALLCAALGGRIAHAGGQVRHSEFRMGPPVSNAMSMGSHRH